MPLLLPLIPRASNQINATSQRSWNKQVESGALGLSGFVPPPNFVDLDAQIRYFTRQSSLLIKNIGEKTARDVEFLVQQSYRKRITKKVFEEQLAKKLNASKNRAAFIARDQTTKLNVGLTKVRHLSAGITRYIWKTAGDIRVRPKHAALEGKVRTWNKELEPGEDPGCRCVPIPYPVDGLADSGTY